MRLSIGSPLPVVLHHVDRVGPDATVSGSLGDVVIPNRPLLIHFWAMSCPACHANMVHLQELRDRFSPLDLQTIGIHRPRGNSDLDIDRLREAIGTLQMTEPCLLDNDHRIGDAMGFTAWPTYYLFDEEHKLRRHAMGNFGVRMMQSALERFYVPT